MRRLILVALAALLTAMVPPAEAAKAKSKTTRAKVVCFKKTVKTKSGRKVRRKVCRPRRTAKAKTVTKAPASAPQPSTTSPDFGKGPGPSPNFVEGPGPSPHVVSGPGPAPDAPACVPEDSEWLTVTALDVNAKFVLRLSRTCLRAGRTIVQYQNQDAQEHDLWVEGTSPAVARREVVAPVDPESLEQVDTTLTAGEWRLFCSIPGHATMSRTVTVVR